MLFVAVLLLALQTASIAGLVPLHPSRLEMPVVVPVPVPLGTWTLPSIEANQVAQIG